MSRTQSNFYTKAQLQYLFNAWQCTRPIPKKGQNVVIAWPYKGEWDVDLIVAEWTSLKGTYGDKLYKVTQSSRAGRALDEVVQESHVHAFSKHLADQLRMLNLERHQTRQT